MAENWGAIAAEIATAIADVGFIATLEQPGDAVLNEYDGWRTYPILHDISVIDDRIQRRDDAGNVTTTKRVLTVGANSVVPGKGWYVTVRGKQHRIAAVMPLAPGGVDLLYDLELES